MNKVVNNIDKWAKEESVRLDVAVAKMGNDIMKTSRILNPVDSGDLRASTRLERLSAMKYRVSVNTPYARRRHFENRKNPQTLHYLQRSGESAKSNVRKYLT